MKKYLFALAASLLLFGGIGTAQAEPLLTDVKFTVVGGEPLSQEAPDGPYVLITDGNPDTEYLIDFDGTTVSLPGTSLEVGLCLKGINWTSVEQLEEYYSLRNPPEPYLSYLMGALQESPEGQNPFAVVKSFPESNAVYLCDGAVFSLSAEEDCVPMRIPGDYPNGLYTVSSCNEEDPQLSFDLLILVDTDGDGVADAMDACPNSDPTADLDGTVVIDGCDSGVPNTLIKDGCTISDRIMACADGAVNHGEFVSCVAQFTNDLKSQGLLSGAEKGAIQNCAAQSNEDASGLGQNRHRARYELLGNDLVIPCVEIGGGQYFAVDMNLSSATSNNFHFKVKKAEIMNQAEIHSIEDPGQCADYDLISNSLIFPSLQIGEKQWRVRMKLLGANSANLHFKLQSITEVQVP
jgi:hypothetical protein